MTVLYCMKCTFQRPNYFKGELCPKCGSYLKYVEAAAKSTTIKLYKAGLHVSYAVAEIYDFANEALHTTNVYFGFIKPYESIVFRNLPAGYDYTLPKDFTKDFYERIPVAHVVSPMHTYGVLRYEADYLDRAEAKTSLRKKLKELDSWIDEAVADGWLSICNLGGML